jgi:hypothetical protein
MARRVTGGTLENWQWTGSDVLTPQATVDASIEWIDDNGDPQTWSGTITFPDDLQLLPVAWVREALEDLLMRALRKRIGVDP